MPDVEVGHRFDDRVEVVTTSERGERAAVRLCAIVVADLRHDNTVCDHATHTIRADRKRTTAGSGRRADARSRTQR